MKLTEGKAIRECKELWAEIEKSGKSKKEFLDTLEGKKWEGKKYDSECPLCEYGRNQLNDCPKCPLVIQFRKDCFGLGYDIDGCSPEWFQAVRGLKE